MRKLYFDIDGTLLLDEVGILKPALTEGAFQAAVIQAGFEELVCVGAFVTALHVMREVEPDHDGVGAIFSLCGGAFTNEDWFRSVTTLVDDPMERGKAIDLDSNWWYVDDMAEYYLWKAGRESVFKEHVGERIWMPDPKGDGYDILAWLERLH